MMQVRIMTWQISVEQIKPTSEELIANYNAVAHQWQQKLRRFGYDRVYAHLFAQLHDVLRASFADHNSISVLDCGVGSGALSEALYKSRHKRLTLRGVDTSPAMACTARRHLTQQSVPVQIELEDVRSLPYDDNVFDMVMSAHTLEHLPQPQAGLREMIRVLRPGAPLLIVTTRPGLLGSFIDAQWGLTCLDESTLIGACLKTGLHNVQAVPLAGPRWCRHMSYAVLGWKKRRIRDGFRG